MGVLPGSGGDVNTTDGIFLNSANGNGTQSLSELDTLNQSKVEGVYKNKNLGAGKSVWSDNGGPLGLLFQGIAGLPDAFGQLVTKLTGVNGPFNSIESVIAVVEQVPIIGDFVQLAEQVVNGFKGIFDSWFGGSSGTGTPEEVKVTVKSIRVLTKDGYTLQTFVSSDPAWAVPPELAAAEVAWGGAIGGGGRGGGGGVGGGTLGIGYGGLGGVDGGYTLAPIDPKSLGSTIAVVIGAAASTGGTAGGTTSINGITSTPGISGISTPEGYQSSTSKPGSGGTGGDGWTVQGNPGPSSDGKRGEPSATAAGGSAGVGGGNGTAGAAGATSDVPIAGGGGGGGGGGRGGFGLTGATGGNGGYPGGGSGGGGGVGSTGGGGNGGAPGAPGQGFAFLIWK